MTKFIHDTAIINESEIGDVKLFRNTVINNSKIADGCSVGDDTTIERCVFETNVAINRRSYINDSFIGRFSYTGINTTINDNSNNDNSNNNSNLLLQSTNSNNTLSTNSINTTTNWTKIGRFCSIARNVDIGGFDHDYHKVTTMPEFRFRQIMQGGGKIPEHEKHNDYCEIGNDVWIAANAQILHKVKISDGAVVGAGAVVTHNVPPYAIVVGVPARIIGFRCEQHLIDELLNIQWWNWPIFVITQNIELLLKEDICNNTIDKMIQINSQINYHT